MKVSGDIGVISDTHALLRPEAVRALDGCELILHAGDIGNSRVIPALKERAAVVAIRGNIDKDPWADEYPISEAIEVNGKFIYLIHNIGELDLDPFGTFDAVVFGHSHQPKNEQKNGVLYFNPGSAGPRRFSLPIAVGRLTTHKHGITGKIIELSVDQSA
ncbi:MAG: phosphoesterase [Nitrosomonas sp.]|nr:MAG: phosphoesterase [Nitrosomonas sp.]